jgi:anti-anti-sigma factor
MLSDRDIVASRCEHTRPRWRRPRRTVEIALRGEIDLATSGDLLAELCGCLVGSARVITVDLGHVTFMDATGINACLMAQRQGRALGYDLRFANPQGAVARVIEILDLEAVLLGEDDR